MHDDTRSLKPVPRSAVMLTISAIVAAAAASIITLAWAGSFRDASPESIENGVLAEARGWSAATLLVSIPLAVASLRAARRGSIRGRLVWLGGLVYFVYTYLEFAVSPPFSALYLPYVVAFASAVCALVIGVGQVDVAELPMAFGDRVPRVRVVIFSFLFVALLASAWLGDIASRTLAGTFGWPVGKAAVQHVVHALDLGLQVPLGVATGVLLLRRSAAGLLLAAIMLVNVVCMGAALTGMALWSTTDAGTSAWVAAPFAFVCLIGVALAIVFFRSARSEPGAS